MSSWLDSTVVVSELCAETVTKAVQTSAVLYSHTLDNFFPLVFFPFRKVHLQSPAIVGDRVWGEASVHQKKWGQWPRRANGPYTDTAYVCCACCLQTPQLLSAGTVPQALTADVTSNTIRHIISGLAVSALLSLSSETLWTYSCHSNGERKADMSGKPVIFVRLHQLKSVREPRELEGQPCWFPK